MCLIDADALKEEIAVAKEHVAKHQDPTISLLTYVIDGFSALVDKQPTIDAIPVEWLEEHDGENISDSDGNIYGRRYITISEALSMWQKEQGAR